MGLKSLRYHSTIGLSITERVLNSPFKRKCYQYLRNSAASTLSSILTVSVPGIGMQHLKPERRAPERGADLHRGGATRVPPPGLWYQRAAPE